MLRRHIHPAPRSLPLSLMLSLTLILILTLMLFQCLFQCLSLSRSGRRNPLPINTHRHKGTVHAMGGFHVWDKVFPFIFR